jgi:hypothetical protein
VPRVVGAGRTEPVERFCREPRAITEADRTHMTGVIILLLMAAYRAAIIRRDTDERRTQARQAQRGQHPRHPRMK